MEIGLLWYDNSTRDLQVKVHKAAQGYRKRFGGDPNVCYVHPTTLPTEDEQRVDGIVVRPSRQVLKHHFWVGEERQQK
jgi:hypothetical protein